MICVEQKAKARGCFLGLAVGDALGQTTEGKSQMWIQQHYGRITGFTAASPGGSDDTEYALLSAELLLEHGFGLKARHVAAAWRKYLASQTGGFKGAGFSEMAAIDNLRRGYEPPRSGQHNHSSSDGFAMRAAPFGIAAAGRSTLAAALALEDGQVSHAGEGIYSGQLVAAAVAEAMAFTGSPNDGWQHCLERALPVIPEDCWTSRMVRRAAAIGRECSTIWDALPSLNEHIACHDYFWSDLGPEAVGLAFGCVAAARGRFSDAVLGAVNMGRDTDTIAAIAGAYLGALGGLTVIPFSWQSEVSAAKGICIQQMAGKSVLAAADALAALQQRKGGNGP